MKRNRKLEDDLERAISTNQFELYYQPKQELETGRLSGMEALIRWMHPELGEIQPPEFIPIAERTRLIIPLGAWVLRQACDMAVRINNITGGSLSVAVNLSALQFADASIFDTVRQALDESGLDPRCLELEITETVAMRNVDEASQLFGKLAELGVSISIDDFGVGYSSLAYLKSFPVQRIKIDRIFVEDISSDENGGSIARAITTMGHSLDMAITAEGVTTKEQISFLKRLDCDEIQGDYLSPPLNDHDFEAFVRSYERPAYPEQTVLDWSGIQRLGEAQRERRGSARRRVKDERTSG